MRCSCASCPYGSGATVIRAPIAYIEVAVVKGLPWAVITHYPSSNCPPINYQYIARNNCSIDDVLTFPFLREFSGRRHAVDPFAIPSHDTLNARDYRFFEADMIHPNEVAVDYIWDKLVDALFSDEAIRTMAEVCTISVARLLCTLYPPSAVAVVILCSSISWSYS